MDIHLNKKEIEAAVKKYSETESIIKNPKTVKIIISWENSEYIFPPHIAEILSKCEVKAVVSCE
jgi:hypothetical protein